MLRKIRFPRMVIPLSVSLTSLFNLGMNFIAVIVFALANGITPMLSWLEMIPIVLGFVMLATGIGMLLSALYVRYRDIQPIWEVLVQAWFYLSPVMYTAASTRRQAAGRGVQAPRAAQPGGHAADPDGSRIHRPNRHAAPRRRRSPAAHSSHSSPWPSSPLACSTLGRWVRTSPRAKRRAGAARGRSERVDQIENRGLPAVAVSNRR